MRRLQSSKGAKGNTLTMFAEKYLVKKAYFELSNENVNLTCVWRSLARTAQAVYVLVGMQLPLCVRDSARLHHLELHMPLR